MTLTWTPKTPDYQVFITRPGMFQSLLLFPLLFIMLPLVAWLTKVNMDISLPDLLIRSEEDAGLIIEHFFNHQGIGRFALNMVMIALIPAIGEELFFRGILQQYLARGIKNVHLAVLISAFIFSFFHFQFQGFIPRMGLGMLFGYLLVWSGSIWLPVLAHFINNGSAVLVEFLYQRGEIQTGHQEFGTNTTPVVVIISTIATFTLCYLIYKGRSASEAPNEPSRIE